MQITGEICQRCGHPVEPESETAACRHCKAAFHRNCLVVEQSVCPACNLLWNEAAETVRKSEIPDAPSLYFVETKLKLPRISLFGRLSLLLVCAAMVSLPLIYLALVGTVGFGVVYFAIHFYAVLGSSGYHPLEIIALFPFYLAPLIFGILFALLLIKPFFAPPRREAEVFPLDHEDAPQLFALIGWVCRSLQTPLPSRVELNCGVNAGARLHGGVRGIFGSDIVLSIGLPLAAGLNLSQLAGVIAHEYGHLSRGKTMRADYFIQHINRWFYDAVYEPDDWDLYLRGKCDVENQEWLVLSFLYLLRGGIALGRGVMWLLLVGGNLFSSILSRQMEFDADQYELKISGSEMFVSTTMRLQQLSLGLAMAQKQMVTKWKKEQKLFDHIPDLIVSRADEISADTQENHYARVFKRKTRLFDQHPSDAERMQRARSAKEPGVFHVTSPAKTLFVHYPELSRRLTLFFYRDLIGSSFSSKSLVSMEQKMTPVEHDYNADRNNIRLHFFGVVTDLRPLLITENKLLNCRSQQILHDEILASRLRMTKSLPVVRAALVAFILAQTRQAQAGQAARLLAAGFQFEPAEFGLGESDAEAAQIEARTELQAAARGLETFETDGKLRLLNAMQMLPLPYIAALIPNANQLQDDAREMIHVLSRLNDLFEPLLELSQNCATLELLMGYRKNQPAADNSAAVLENLCLEIQECVNAIQERVNQIRYPFNHEIGQVMIGEFLRNTEYHADPFELALREGRSHVEKLMNIHDRLLGNLVVICREVEKHLIENINTSAEHEDA